MKLFILLTGLLLCTPSFAGSVTGKVTQVLVHSDGGNDHGVIMFRVEGQRRDKPVCSTAYEGKAWAISLEKISGRLMFSLILSAQAQGKTIFIAGRGHCKSWPDREEPRFIRLIN